MGRLLEVIRSESEKPVSDEVVNTGVLGDGSAVSIVTTSAVDDAPVFPALSLTRALTEWVPSVKVSTIVVTAFPAATSSLVTT